MLQFTFGLPFLQCPVPSAVSFTVVNAAPLTGVLAMAPGEMNAAAATATPSATTPVMALSRNHLFIRPLSLPITSRRHFPYRWLSSGSHVWPQDRAVPVWLPFLPPPAWAESPVPTAQARV